MTRMRCIEAIAVMGKAFASPVRLELLDLLAQAPRSVDDLARASGQSTANTSQHLQALHAAGMVTRAREGTSVRYADRRRPGAALVARAARRVGVPAGRGRARRARLPRRGGRDDRSRRADRADAPGRCRPHRRSSEEGIRRRAHRRRAVDPGRGARAVVSAELPVDSEIVAYCRGPFCAYAHDAVRRLRAAGRTARRLHEGWPEWRLADQQDKSKRAA